MAPAIVIDTRQQAGKHDHKDEWFAAHGIETLRRKLDFGDYMRDGSNLSVDTKRNVDEIAQNINGRNHDRFTRECQRAAEAGCRLVVLVENLHGYTCIEDVRPWVNGHCRACVHYRRRTCVPRDPKGKCPRHGTRKPIQGPRLAKAMETMGRRYGVRFEFCHPREAAERICELLGVEYGR